MNFKIKMCTCIIYKEMHTFTFLESILIHCPGRMYLLSGKMLLLSKYHILTEMMLYGSLPWTLYSLCGKFHKVSNRLKPKAMHF